MQTPVRYYITQSDDQAVVRTVPVSVNQVTPDRELRTDESQNIPTPDLGTEPKQGRKRVARIVRAATRRSDDHRD